MNWREFSGCIKNLSALLPAVVMIWEVSRASLSTYLDMDVFKGWVFHVKIINPLVLSPCQQRALSLLLAGGVGRTLCASNAAGDGRSPPLFATESTRVRTENRTRGALVFFTFTKNHTRNQHFCFFVNKKLFIFKLFIFHNHFHNIFQFQNKVRRISGCERKSARDVWLGSVFNKNGLLPRREEWQWAMRSVPSLWHPRVPLPAASLRHRVRKFQKWIEENVVVTSWVLRCVTRVGPGYSRTPNNGGTDSCRSSLRSTFLRK